MAFVSGNPLFSLAVVVFMIVHSCRVRETQTDRQENRHPSSSSMSSVTDDGRTNQKIPKKVSFFIFFFTTVSHPSITHHRQQHLLLLEHCASHTLYSSYRAHPHLFMLLRRFLSSSSTRTTTATTIVDTSTTQQQRRRLALVLGVANHRSIAWACVQQFLRKDIDVVFTYLPVRPQQQQTMDKLIATTTNNDNGSSSSSSTGRILAAIPCNVEHDGALQTLFTASALTDILQQQQQQQQQHPSLDAVVHCIAHANLQPATNFSDTSWQDYAHAQRISAYSFLECAHYAIPYLQRPTLSSSDETPSNHPTETNNSSSSLTAISYLGSTRAVPYYHCMGPAKASLEAIVRGLALELGQSQSQQDSQVSQQSQPSLIRVNAVSAGPVQTVSARSIPNFSKLYRHVSDHAPGGVTTARHVAEVVHFVACDAHGMTGQVVTVDNGYSSIVPV